MKQEFKNLRKQSILENRNRRKSQVCKTYEIKFDKSHLSKEKKEYLNRLFLEAKWFYNYILSQEDIFDFDTKIKTVKVRNKDKELEDRELLHLSSQMRQGIYGRMQDSIKSLSSLKKNGEKVGGLKFKSQVNSIPLLQYDNTYRIESNRKYINIQGFRNHFKVNGLNQIPKDSEITSATLVRRQNDYYLYITCFLPKVEKIFKEEAIGIDFGIKDNLTLSNGEKFNIRVPINNRTKILQKQFKHKTKYSKNWNRLKVNVKKSHRKTFLKKKDKRNKVVSYLTNTFKVICFQDENIKEWHQGWFGKQVQESIMGGIISDLKLKSETSIVVDKWFPSTKLCPNCKRKNDIGLDERIYSCICGYSKDRDVHSARNVLTEGLKQLEGDGEHITLSPVEIGTSKLLKSNSLSSDLRSRKPMAKAIGSSHTGKKAKIAFERSSNEALRN